MRKKQLTKLMAIRVHGIHKGIAAGSGMQVSEAQKMAFGGVASPMKDEV